MVIQWLLGVWGLAPGTWNLEIGTRNLELGTRISELDIWDVEFGI